MYRQSEILANFPAVFRESWEEPLNIDATANAYSAGRIYALLYQIRTNPVGIGKITIDALSHHLATPSERLPKECSITKAHHLCDPLR
jgi:hypothetical protein